VGQGPAPTDELQAHELMKWKVPDAHTIFFSSSNIVICLSFSHVFNLLVIILIEFLHVFVK
jgi:hypothetical protein